MSGRPAKGSPLTLVEHFLWTLIGAGIVMVGVLGGSYAAQSNDPAQMQTWVCVPQPDHIGVAGLDVCEVK